MSTYPLKKLSEVCEIEYGTRVVNRRDGGKIYSVYGGGGATFFMDEYNREDQMIIARFAMSEKCTRFVKGKFFLNDSGLTVSTKNNETLSQVFLDLYLLSLNDLIYSLGRGTAQKNLNVEKFKDIQIPLPPLSVQEEIVAKLDTALVSIEEAKAKTQQVLTATRELWESTLEEAFRGGDSWEEKRFDEVYDVRDGTHDSPKYHTTGYPLITSKNLQPEGLSFSNIKLISEKDYQKINERSKVHKGDILFAMIGTIGNATIVEIEPEFAIKNVALFKVPENQNNMFLKYFLSSKAIFQKMISEAKGTTQKFVGLGYLRGFPIRLPSLSEQSRIVAHLDAVRAETDQLASLYEQKLADLDELRRSVLQEAFTLSD